MEGINYYENTYLNYIEQGDQYINQGMYDYADDYYNKAISLYPPCADLINAKKLVRGFSFYEAGTDFKENDYTAYFSKILEYKNQYINGNLDADMYYSIMFLMLDLETIFYNEIADILLIISNTSSSGGAFMTRENIEGIEFFTKYLEKSMNPRITELIEELNWSLSNQYLSYTAHAPNINRIISYGYLIMLSDIQLDFSYDDGYRVSTESWSSFYSSSEIKKSTRYGSTFRSRLEYIYHEQYFGEYYKRFLLAANLTPDNKAEIIKYQEEFERIIFSRVSAKDTLKLVPTHPFCIRALGGKTNKRNKEADVDLLGYVLRAFLLGSLGVHDFYAGYKKKGIIHLIIFFTIFLAPFSFVWGLIEGIQALIKGSV